MTRLLTQHCFNSRVPVRNYLRATAMSSVMCISLKNRVF